MQFKKYLTKNNLIVIGLLILAALAFYWFAYRPYKAKRDCAWHHMHVDAKPYIPQKGTPPTSEEIDKWVADCSKKESLRSAGRMNFVNLFCARDQYHNGYEPERAAEPEKNWWAQTDVDDYKACLRGKGF